MCVANFMRVVGEAIYTYIHTTGQRERERESGAEPFPRSKRGPTRALSPIDFMLPHMPRIRAKKSGQSPVEFFLIARRSGRMASVLHADLCHNDCTIAIAAFGPAPTAATAA